MRRTTGKLQKDLLCTFMIMSRRIHLRMRSILEQCCSENQNTYFMFNIFFRKSRHL